MDTLYQTDMPLNRDIEERGEESDIEERGEESDIEQRGEESDKEERGEESWIPPVEHHNLEVFASVKNKINTNVGFNILGTVIAILAVCVGCYLVHAVRTERTERSEVDVLKETIINIKKDFPSQSNDIWQSFFVHIKYVIESHPTRPAIFLLLHNDSEKVAGCLAWRIGKAAGSFFKTDGVTEITAKAAETLTNRNLVSDYRDQLNNTGVMVVHQLDKFSGSIVQGFHSFCDSYNPLVERAVLLFTFNNSQVNINKHWKANKKAKVLMRTLWQDTLFDSVLDPLITRFTGSVLEIESEPRVVCTL